MGVGWVYLPVAAPVIMAIELPLAKNSRTMLWFSGASEPRRSRAGIKDAMAEPLKSVRACVPSGVRENGECIPA